VRENNGGAPEVRDQQRHILTCGVTPGLDAQLLNPLRGQNLKPGNCALGRRLSWLGPAVFVAVHRARMTSFNAPARLGTLYLRDLRLGFDRI
jgi:hypothetical protein